MRDADRSSLTQGAAGRLQQRRQGLRRVRRLPHVTRQRVALCTRASLRSVDDVVRDALRNAATGTAYPVAAVLVHSGHRQRHRAGAVD